MYNFFYIIFGNVEHREDKLSANPELMSYKSIYNTTLFQYFPDEVCTANEKLSSSPGLQGS